MATIETQRVESSTGFHSTIHQGNLPDQSPFLIKTYGEKAHGFQREEAKEIIRLMRRFAEIGEEIGVTVVHPHEHFLEANGHPKRVNLAEAVPMVGTDLREHWSDPSVTDGEVLEDMADMLDLHRKVWQADFPISLDPPPANFCKNDGGEIIYIDTMPPRQQLPDGKKISEWPAPSPDTEGFIEQRYFSPQQAEVIYPQLLRAIGDRQISPDQIKFVVGEKLGPQAFAEIDIAPERREIILFTPAPPDTDRLRIIAAEAYSNGQINKDTLDKIFHLTHIGIGGILPDQESISIAADLLKTSL